MANPEHVAKLKEGVEAWNAWLALKPGQKAGLARANLAQLDLSGFNLDKADLKGADLTGADLEDANLRLTALNNARLNNAKLTRADFDWADLRMADLTGADLSGANLSGANLGGANLTLSRLKYAILAGADLSGAVLANVDLSATKGLSDSRHRSPSHISQQTLQRSGLLPETFLRGAGFADWEIESTKLFDPDLTPNEITEILYRVHELRSARPIQIHQLFISYSHKNADFVNQVEPLLHESGVLFWRDIHDMTVGRMDRQIERAIDENRTLLIVLSEASIKSDWVEYEIGQGVELSKRVGRDTLCPIALDDAWKTCKWPGPLQKQVKNFNILDFSQWRDPKVLEVQYRKLIKGLKLFYQPNGS